VRGLAKGTYSLFNNTIYAFSNAATRMSKAAHKVHKHCLGTSTSIYVNLFLGSGRLGKTPRSSCLQVRIGRLHVWDVIDGKSRYCAILQGVTTFAFDKEYVAKLMRCEQLKHK
jgi:hypothetical protein